MSNLEKIKQLRQSTGAGFKDCGLAIFFPEISKAVP